MERKIKTTKMKVLPQENQRLNGYQYRFLDHEKGETSQGKRLMSMGKNSWNLVDHKVENLSNVRLKEQNYTAESRMERRSLYNQKKTNTNLRRMGRDLQNDTEIRTATEHMNDSLQCEVPFLSCRNCCDSSKKCGRERRICHCDPMCMFYEDCCVDYETYCGKEQNISFGSAQAVLACITPQNVDLKNDNKPIWMVTKCPKDKKVDEISRKCKVKNELTLNTKNLRRLIPVISSNNVTFRNEFCAKCNGIQNFEYYSFNVNMKCQVIPPASVGTFAKLAEFASKYCQSKSNLSIFKELEQPTCECRQSTFGFRCDEQREIEKICEQQSWSNDTCISKFNRCNAHLHRFCKSEPAETSFLQPSYSVKPSPSSMIAPLTFAFRWHKILTFYDTEKPDCPGKEQFYDSYLETCRVGQSISPLVKRNLDKFDIVVWFDTTKLQSQSLRPTYSSAISSLAKLFNFKCNQVTSIEEIKSSYSDVPAFPEKYYVLRFELELTNEQTLRLGKVNDTNKTTAQFINNSTTPSSVLPLQRLLSFSTEFEVTVSVYDPFLFRYGIVRQCKEADREMNTTLTVFKTTSRQLSCIRKQTYVKGTYSSLQNGDFYYINVTGKTFPKKQVFFAGNESISVCEQIVFSTCVGHRVNLSSEEYVQFDNLSILYKRKNKIYEFGEYDIEEGEIVMCIPDESVSKITNWISNNSLLIETYLTLICLILSLICLFLVIQTYLIFSELRNLPGKNLMNLAISLFLVHLFWLIPDRWHPTTLCHVAAGIKHYTFLVSFFAMTTIAWHTFSVFARKSIRNTSHSTSHENRTFCKYSAIVWGLPAIFVVTCVGLDHGDVYAVYVNDQLCWFDNVQAQEYLFVLPVGLLLLSNVVLFALTVFRMQRDRSSTQIIRSNQRHGTMFWIYLRISALMGFCWLFGFLYLAAETPVFSYLFTVFASLQGVYIAVAFVMKKAIWEKYKKLLKRKKYTPSYQSTLIESLGHTKETTV